MGNKLKKARKSSVELIKTGIITGVGASVIGSLGGGQVGANAQVGLSNFSRGFRPVGSVLGADLTLGLVSDLNSKKKIKGRRGGKNGFF